MELVKHRTLVCLLSHARFRRRNDKTRCFAPGNLDEEIFDGFDLVQQVREVRSTTFA
jgi:hypothetical protein